MKEFKIYFLIIAFSLLSFDGQTKNEEVISFYCNFKFLEFKQGSMISSKNVAPDPKKVCEEWKCGEMLNIKFKTENKKKIIFSNGILRNQEVNEFKITDKEIFLNTPLPKDSLVFIKYKIIKQSGVISKEIREYDYFELTKDKSIKNFQIEPQSDNHSSLKGIYKFDGKCVEQPNKNF